MTVQNPPPRRVAGPRRRALDLGCGAGGASMGYHLAGFDVTGWDNEPHPDYPFEFVLGDMRDALTDVAYLLSFDLVAASPPCKSENDLRHLSSTEHPDLLTPTLAALRPLDVPWIVENVASTKKMRDPVLLCGASFGLGATCRDGVYRHLERHRKFESNLPLMSSGCACPKRQPGGVYGTGGGGQMTRGYKFHPEEAREAMGITWMRTEDICQAIPPAYTRFLGEQAFELIAAGRAAPAAVSPWVRYGQDAAREWFRDHPDGVARPGRPCGSGASSSAPHSGGRSSAPSPGAETSPERTTVTSCSLTPGGRY